MIEQEEEKKNPELIIQWLGQKPIDQIVKEDLSPNKEVSIQINDDDDPEPDDENNYYHSGTDQKQLSSVLKLKSTDNIAQK